jgi:hypothetical protein
VSNSDAGGRRHGASAAVASILKWDQRFESAFLQQRVGWNLLLMATAGYYEVTRFPRSGRRNVCPPDSPSRHFRAILT